MDDPFLRILITDPHLKGGGQVRYVTQLGKALRSLGHDVTIGCKEHSVLADLGREAGCSVYNAFRFRGGLRPAAWWHDVREVQRFLRERRPDILHANGSQDHWVCAVANRLGGFPACMVRSRHNTYAVSESWPNRKLNLVWTDYQIAVCKAVFDMRATRPVFDGSRMCVIHNGVEPDRFRPDANTRKRVRAAFGFDDETVVVGIAARLALAKGHRYLFEAAQRLKDAFPHLRLLVLGQGVLRESLETMARDLGIASITTFAGFRDDIADCIQAFDIGVQPSVDCEASSFSVMEQMATEKPIVTSDHGGTKEIVRHGIDGYVVPQGTVAPLAEALQSLLADPSKREQMGRSARDRIAREFTVDLLASRTVEAYRRAIAIHRERTPRAAA